MKVKWYCGHCKQYYKQKFNLDATQTGFVIKTIQVECPLAHTKIVKV